MLPRFLLYLFFPFAGLFIPCVISAQEFNEAWFESTIASIETADTVGLEKELGAELNSSASKEDQLRHRLAYCYLVIYTERHPLEQKAIQECIRLDSLVRNDAFHNQVRFIEGYYYYGTYNYPIALEILNEAALAFGNKAQSLLEARCFMIRAFIMQSLGYSEDADKCLMIALTFYHQNKYVKKEAAIYNNLSLNSNERHDTVNAFHYMSRAIALRDSIHDLYGLGQCYNNLGTINYDIGHYEKALAYYEKGLDFRLRGGAPETGLIESRINIGRTLYKVGKTQDAIDTLESCFKQAVKASHFELRRRICDELRTIYFEQGNYQRAFEMQEMYYDLQDSLYNRSMKEEVVRRTVEYEFRIREKEEEIRQHEKDKQSRIIVISLCVGLLLAGIFVYNLYKGNRQKKQANAIIMQQRDILDKKQQEITESIRYARFIQQTLLPVDSALEHSVHEHFVFYQPKDIVSGDFYWLWPIGGEECLVAAADCTGHGVPGAFMSLLAKENLDKAAAITQKPGEILSYLNRAVKKSLRQNDRVQQGLTLQDGLDAVLVQIKGSHLTYAGANRPLWIFRKAENKIEEVKPTKAAIGGSTSVGQVFEETSVELKAGDVLYLFTDGFADQFGGDKKKKLTSKKFRELLESISKLSAVEQKNSLLEFFTRWKGGEEQIDDVLVIGIKIRT